MATTHSITHLGDACLACWLHSNRGEVGIRGRSPEPGRLLQWVTCRIDEFGAAIRRPDGVFAKSNYVQGMRSVNCRYLPRVNSHRQPGPSKAFPRHLYSVLAPSGVLAACGGSGPATTATAVLPSVTISASPTTVGVRDGSVAPLELRTFVKLDSLVLEADLPAAQFAQTQFRQSCSSNRTRYESSNSAKYPAASCSCMHPSAT
jgi:hypothetical protein